MSAANKAWIIKEEAVSNKYSHRDCGGTHEFHGKGELVVEQLQDIVHTLLSRVWEAPVSTYNI